MNARAWAIECRKRRTRFTPAEVAQSWGVTPAFIRRLMARGLLTYSVGKRGYPLIRSHAIKRALANPAVLEAIARHKRGKRGVHAAQVT